MATSTLGSGTLVLAGTTSGTTTVTATAVAGTTTLTLPAATDTLVGKATTDTLTNKTLTGAVMNGTLGATTPSTVAATTLTTSSTVTHNGGTANGVPYLDGSKVLTTGSALVFDGTNLGVGVTPSAWQTSLGSRAIQFTGSAVYGYRDTNLILSQNAYFDGSWKYYASSIAAGYYGIGSGVHSWFNAPSGTAGNAITFTQAMTLDASGNLLVGTTDTGIDTGVGIKILNDSQKHISTVSSLSTNAGGESFVMYSTGASAYRFYVGWGGTIFATSTVISAISDIRFKENIRDLDAGLSEVLALKPRLYDWKEGKGADIKNARGFIAQEFETVFPDLIDEWKDEAPEGEDPYKSVRQDLIPVLVKAIQEQQTIITQLQADVAALKGA